MNTASHRLPKIKINTRGFTLVETLVAITIFITVIVGPLTIAWSSMQRAYFSNEQTTAIFLAQEALESIRLQRDNQGLVTYKSSVDSDSKAWTWFSGDPNNNDIYNLKDYTQCTNVSTGCDFVRGTNSAEPDKYMSCPSSGCQLQQYQAPGAADSQLGFTYGYGTTPHWKESPYRRKIVVTEEVAEEAVKVVVTVAWQPTLFDSEKTVVLESWLYNQYKRYEK